MKKLHLLLTGGLMLAGMASCVNAGELAGNTEGAQVIRVEKTRGRIDALNDIVYSQVKSTVAVRQLHMSLLVPRNGDLKPAIIYFPGGGFTSAAWNKFIEMRMALAAAGFVVAAAEYRTVPDTFPLSARTCRGIRYRPVAYWRAGGFRRRLYGADAGAHQR